jgi:hypothetical protein
MVWKEGQGESDPISLIGLAAICCRLMPGDRGRQVPRGTTIERRRVILLVTCVTEVSRNCSSLTTLKPIRQKSPACITPQIRQIDLQIDGAWKPSGGPPPSGELREAAPPSAPRSDTLTTSAGSCSAATGAFEPRAEPPKDGGAALSS